MAEFGGTMSVRVTDWNRLALKWRSSGQSVLSNFTVFYWQLILYSEEHGRIDSTAQKTYTVTVDGSPTVGTTTIGIGNSTSKVLASGSKIVYHNNDGTKTINVSYSLDFDITFSGKFIGTVNGSGTVTMEPIPRASTPTLSKSGITMGENVTIYTNRKSDAFTHKLYYGWYGTTWYPIYEGTVKDSYVWQIPLSFANNIPDAVQGWGTIRCETYNGTTKLGTADVTFTAYVPSSMKPSCTFKLTDEAGLYSTYGAYVKGLSTLKVIVTPTIAYNSAIASAYVTVGGVKYTKTPFVCELNKAGTQTVTATVIDKRLRSGSHSANISVLDYEAPAVTKLSVERCEADGTESIKGEYAKVKLSATVTALNNKNAANYVLRYRKSGSTTWTEVTLTSLAGNYSVEDYTDAKCIFPADSGSSYDVELLVSDNHYTKSRATSVSTAFALLHWGADGESLAVGKIAEKNGTFEVGIPAEFNGPVVQKGNSYAAHSVGNAGATGYVALAQLTLTGANANAPITFYLTRRNASGTMTVHARFQNVSNTDPALDSITYEGENYGAYLYQTAPSVWRLYVAKTAADDPITIQRWTTSPFMDERLEVAFLKDTQLGSLPDPYYRATPAKLQSLIDYIYPVGSIYLSYSHVSPADLFGGTWVRIENRFLWAVSASGDIGTLGGESSHTLTVDEMPAHSHGSVYSQHATGTKDKAWYTASGSSVAYGAVSTGGGKAHNNMPPYIQISAWRRTA